jgi:hypothetical protein
MLWLFNFPLSDTEYARNPFVYFFFEKHSKRENPFVLKGQECGCSKRGLDYWRTCERLQSRRRGLGAFGFLQKGPTVRGAPEEGAPAKGTPPTSPAVEAGEEAASWTI